MSAEPVPIIAAWRAELLAHFCSAAGNGACLGKFKPLDRFEWAHLRKIDRALVERLVGLDFVAHASSPKRGAGSQVGSVLGGVPVGAEAARDKHAVAASGISPTNDYILRGLVYQHLKREVPNLDELLGEELATALSRVHTTKPKSAQKKTVLDAKYLELQAAYPARLGW